MGRFAPSPSGPLHFGSLVCALASFLHARANHGKWLVRIEDIDTPRVDSSMNAVILRSLKTHGMHWDDEVVYQSKRHSIYQHYLSELNNINAIYACSCSRKQIRARAPAYDGYCRDRGLTFCNRALRFLRKAHHNHFEDIFLGKVEVDAAIAFEDPVLRRADGIYAYHLAVVADDIEQGVTHIVRGQDLLDTTPIHLSLYSALNAEPAQYLHIPVVVQATGQKLSKQHHSPAIDDEVALNNLRLALCYLGIPLVTQPIFASVDDLITWAIDNWRPNMLSTTSELLVLTTNGVYSNALE